MIRGHQRTLLAIAAVIGLLSVALGAFAAHALNSVLDDAARSRFDLGIRYAFFHCLAIIGAALAMPLAARPGRMLFAGWMFIAGVILFSGSLLLLALTGVRAFAMLTPLGGLGFMLGWAGFALGIGGKRDA